MIEYHSTSENDWWFVASWPLGEPFICLSPCELSYCQLTIAGRAIWRSSILVYGRVKIGLNLAFPLFRIRSGNTVRIQMDWPPFPKPKLIYLYISRQKIWKAFAWTNECHEAEWQTDNRSWPHERSSIVKLSAPEKLSWSTGIRNIKIIGIMSLASGIYPKLLAERRRVPEPKVDHW